MKFFKSKYNIAMLTIFVVGIVLVSLGSLVDILIPIGLDIIAVAMFMEANNIYIANQERKDLDEVSDKKVTFDATNISVDEDVYYVAEDDKKELFKKKVKKYNNTMSFCVLLAAFGFIIFGITIGLYIHIL